MKNYFKNFLDRLEDEEIKKIWKSHEGVKKKFFEFFYKDICEINEPKIIEFGVRHGVSTSLFLDLCNKNNGTLYSIDENDYSNKFKSSKWKFIKTRDDNFKFLNEALPKQADIIFLDTIHKADHVIKILLHYFENLKVGGYFIIDDVSWIPYLKNNKHDHFFKEINNRETFNSLLQIYSLNSNTIDIKFNLFDTGCAIIQKIKDEKIIFSNKKLGREKSWKNFLRIIYKKIFN